MVEGRSTRRMRRGGLWLAAFGIAVIVLVSSWGPARETRPFFRPVLSAADPRLAGLTKARALWRRQLIERRKVVDLVCLVPDVPSFFEAIGGWDGAHFYPILIDEPELALRFVQAFRPSRIVRLPAAPARGDGGDQWVSAMRAVVRSWSDRAIPRIDAETIVIPRGSVAPGLVLSEPESPSLAGAVALAAGRFEPLVRWTPAQRGQDTLTLHQALNTAMSVERLVGRLFPHYEGVGDRCDFLTLAGAWPDRYEIADGPKRGENALDDLIGRAGPDAKRYAFVGRLIGSPAQSVYQAMCSLFLQPDTALLFDGYDGTELPWTDYAMEPAARLLAKSVPVSLWAGPEDGGLGGWYRVFERGNRHGLVLVNSSGTPTSFKLRGGEGHAVDVPWSAPAALVVIHSYSATHPDDPETVAGRWLANGAFVYFGSMNEPYLQAFRTPALVADLLAQGTPIAAAVAKTVDEDPFGTPWRLRLVGDPLFHVRTENERPRRLERWVPTDGLRAIVDEPAPESSVPAGQRLDWCHDQALWLASRANSSQRFLAWARVLVDIDPRALSEPEQAEHQALLAHLVATRPESAVWRSAVEAISPQRRIPALKRALDTVRE